MNNKEKPSWQEGVKNRHKEGIIALLQEQPNKAMRFVDLLAKKDRTGIKSPKGLTEVLQRLINERLVENTHIDIEIERGKPKLGMHGEVLERNLVKKKVEAYGLTTEGRKYQSWWLIHELFDLQDKNSSYVHSLSYGYASFGLSEDIVMGRATEGKLPNFDIPAIPEIEDFIMLETFRKIRENKIKPQLSDYKLLLSFEFDFAQLTARVIELQAFIEDINTGQDVFTDKRLRLLGHNDNIWLFNFLVNYSVFFGDEAYRKNLTAFLKNLSKDKKFYELTQVNPELFTRFMGGFKQGKDPINDKVLFKKLIVPVEKGVGFYNHFSRYIEGARIIKFGDEKFNKKLDEFTNNLSKKISHMSMEWAERDRKEFESKQKGEQK
ncbi:MAG: hypothetical protein KGH61_01700 [Candidatus Micrarchaeota archaeon]|nr:hypothetical protein [Candidatus Micrarchaeota archaeon]MDE1847644.1 hypothetical protein [Candidatus Micrarchaeota archaeon]MDE1864465.1 hypothetical protein [Candidatus Micrarchaeota archaeon]